MRLAVWGRKIKRDYIRAHPKAFCLSNMWIRRHEFSPILTQYCRSRLISSSRLEYDRRTSLLAWRNQTTTTWDLRRPATSGRKSPACQNVVYFTFKTECCGNYSCTSFSFYLCFLMRWIRRKKENPQHPKVSEIQNTSTNLMRLTCLKPPLRSILSWVFVSLFFSIYCNDLSSGSRHFFTLTTVTINKPQVLQFVL